MKQYPNDGKRHPDLSDLMREVLQAFAESWPGIMLWIIPCIAIIWYPDWRRIIGYSLIVLGILGLIHARYRKQISE